MKRYYKLVKRLVIFLSISLLVYILSFILFLILDLRSIQKNDLFTKEIYLEEDAPIAFYSLNQNGNQMLYITNGGHLFLKDLSKDTFLIKDKILESFDSKIIIHNPIVPTSNNNYFYFGMDNEVLFIDSLGNYEDVTFLGKVMETKDLTGIANKYPFLRETNSVLELNKLDLVYFIYENYNDKYCIQVLNLAAFPSQPKNINRENNPKITLERKKDLLGRFYPYFCLPECTHSFYAEVNGNTYKIPTPWGHKVPGKEDVLLYDGSLIWPHKGKILKIN